MDPSRKTTKYQSRATQENSKRKHDKELVVPKADAVSDLKISYNEAKEKREETKKRVRAETTAIRNAKKKLDRIRAKTNALSNKELEENYLLHMQQVAALKEKRKREAERSQATAPP